MNTKLILLIAIFFSTIGIIRAQDYLIEVKSGTMSKNYKIQDIEFLNFSGINTISLNIIFNDSTRENRDLDNSCQIKFLKAQDNSYSMNIICQGKDTLKYELEKLARVEILNINDIPEQKEIVLQFLNNYPNPFVQSTTINFTNEKDSELNIHIVDNSGRIVKDFGNKFYIAGTNYLNWDGKDDDNKLIPSGSYYCIIQNGNSIITRKMINIK